MPARVARPPARAVSEPGSRPSSGTCFEQALALALTRPRRSGRANQLGEPGESVWIGRRQYTVAEVEDVARAAGGAAEDIAGARLDTLPRAEQQRGVEIALDPAVSDLGPG